MNPETGEVYRGAEVAAAVERGETVVELPGSPVPGCHVCRGHGTKKSWGTPYKFGACPKCYPDHPMKAMSFGHHLRHAQGSV